MNTTTEPRDDASYDPEGATHILDSIIRGVAGLGL